MRYLKLRTQFLGPLCLWQCFINILAIIFAKICTLLLAMISANILTEVCDTQEFQLEFSQIFKKIGALQMFTMNICKNLLSDEISKNLIELPVR